MEYSVNLIKSEEGYAVQCPELPGCWSQGATEEEALANIQEAIKDYVETEVEYPTKIEKRKVQVAV